MGDCVVVLIYVGRTISGCRDFPIALCSGERMMGGRSSYDDE